MTPFLISNIKTFFLTRRLIFSLLDDSDLEVFNFTSYGKTFMKQAKCSPDAYVQMVLQLTYYK